MPITPAAFAASEVRVFDLLKTWGWRVQPWGQATIADDIREILQLTENGLRHVSDLLAARPATPHCDQCRRPHGDLVICVDPKSTMRAYDRRTGKLTIEIRSWMSLRGSDRYQVPAVVVFELFRDCPDTQLRWMPVHRLDPQDMWIGPDNGNGSGDPYFWLAERVTRRIAGLRCWDGWS